MRETFEEYIGLSPQTRIDIDEVLRRSRRIRRRRRLQGVAACLTGLAVLGVVVLSVAILPRKGSQQPPPAVAASTTPQVSDADRLLAALKAAIAREAPQVSGLDGLDRYVLQCAKGNYRKVPAGPGVKAVPCPTQSGRPGILDIDRQYLWRGRLTSPTGTYIVDITISPTTYYDPSAPPVDATDAEERRIAAEQGEAAERGPNGESILATNYLLNVAKPDGTGILIKAWDADEKGAYMTRSPFTAAQLKAIGGDPALHI